MDPRACLERASRACDDAEYSNAREALRDYWDWRKTGGFEPVVGAEPGDFRACQLAAVLNDRDPDAGVE